MEHLSEMMGGNQRFLKRINRLKILNTLRSKGPLSKTQLARLSGLNNKTITNIIEYLIKKGIVTSVGLLKTDEGRKKEHFKLNSDYCFSIGIDLGASHISAILINLEGKILLKKTFNFRFGLKKDIVLEKIFALTQSLIEEAKDKLEKIIGMGFTAPGFFDIKRGVWEEAVNIKDWKQVPIKKLLEERFNKKVYLEDCSRSMALGELWYGKGKDIKDFILLDLGQGIGCGIVINGILLEGKGLKAGEIGHLIIDEKGPVCTCGNRGCLEACASGRALVSKVQEEIRKGQKTKIYDLVNGKVDEITLQDVIEAASLQDSFAIEVLEEAGHRIGRVVSFLINIFNPPLIVLGGQLSISGKHFTGSLIETARKYSMAKIFKETEIKISNLGPFGAALGAATIAIQETLFTP